MLYTDGMRVYANAKNKINFNKHQSSLTDYGWKCALNLYELLKSFDRQSTSQLRRSPQTALVEDCELNRCGVCVSMEKYWQLLNHGRFKGLAVEIKTIEIGPSPWPINMAFGGASWVTCLTDEQDVMFCYARLKYSTSTSKHQNKY